MDAQGAPSGPVIDVQALAAGVPENPSSLRGAPPDFDEIPTTGNVLEESVFAVVLESPDDPQYRQLLQSAFNTYVGGLMHKRGLDRAEAIRRACELVERTVQEARRP